MHVYSKIILCTINPENGNKSVYLSKKKEFISINLDNQPKDIVPYIKESIFSKYKIDISFAFLKLQDIYFQDNSLIIVYSSLINVINTDKLLALNITELYTQKFTKQDIDYVQRALQTIY